LIDQLFSTADRKRWPPNATRIFSPDETEARKSIKRSTNWTGYKVHLTENCEEDLPHLNADSLN
jgi:transposase